jgi:hypothetical protein
VTLESLSAPSGYPVAGSPNGTSGLRRVVWAVGPIFPAGKHRSVQLDKRWAFRPPILKSEGRRRVPQGGPQSRLRRAELCKKGPAYAPCIRETRRRLGRLDDSDLISRHLERIDMRLVASPDYLERAGTPRTVAELANHRGILTRTDLDHWTIDNQSIRILWHISTGNMLVTHDAVRAGHGIAMVPGFLADAAIANGSLVRVLPRSRLDQLEATALRARSATPSVAAKALLKHLT